MMTWKQSSLCEEHEWLYVQHRRAQLRREQDRNQATELAFRLVDNSWLEGFGVKPFEVFDREAE